MLKDLIWISLLVIGFCLGLLPRPKIVFTIVTVCAVSAAAYILSGYQGEQQGVLFGAVMIGGPLAAGLVTVGALVGSWGRKYAANGKARSALLIAAIIFSSAAFLVFKSVQHYQAMIDQERLALEFVKQSKEVVQEVGSDANANVMMHKVQHDTTVGYDIFVRGSKILYVTVEVSRQAGKPIFSLACITRTSQRDLYEHSCKR
ncbi:hypothetical protein ILT44_05150 [Microvirga sp. BT689]|uniref:hypothetical protein n=1 Tax=Microvirga arvi TaxID=2778731 RepID=UPI00194F52B5|nr:hypothetical protein [Microvirga arvi]MBM6579561.1 hypothetical protein [Microvirga arvi]